MVVDSCVWVSGLLAEDAHHAAATSWLRSQAEADLAIPALALAEVAGAIARRTGASADGLRAIETLRGLLTLTIVALDEGLGSEAARVAAEYRIRGADAVYVAAAARLGMPLVTFDDELATRAQALVQVIRPTA